MNCPTSGGTPYRWISLLNPENNKSVSVAQRENSPASSLHVCMYVSMMQSSIIPARMA